MKEQEAIKIIECAQAEVEWNYPLDYSIAFDKAIEALKYREKAEKTIQELYNQMQENKKDYQRALEEKQNTINVQRTIIDACYQKEVEE